MILLWHKPVKCPVRKCHPVGTPKLCEKYCIDFKLCLEVNERDIHGFPLKNEWRLPRELSPRSKFCSICDRPLAKSSTPWGPTCGLFAMHYKAKHPVAYQDYKNKLLKMSQMYYVGAAPPSFLPGSISEESESEEEDRADRQ